MSILEQIIVHKKTEIAALPGESAPPRCPADFTGFLQARPALIAEIKARSPSAGQIVADFEPLAVARDYLAGGADALSVLTDARYFGGGFEVLREVRALTDTPLLCKDFIIDEKQIYHARAHGADMCLLIVKILTGPQLIALKQATENLGMKAVIEVQDRQELATALAAEPEILLINNRNLASFDVDRGNAGALAAHVPPGIKVIAASGLESPEQVQNAPARLDGFLIGTALMQAPDKIAFLRKCRS